MGKSLELQKEIMTREILYPLWDTGMKVGHASREYKEALNESQRDIRNKNSMLDARFICGKEKLPRNLFLNFELFVDTTNPENI